jgi:hypothetical protein
VLAANERVRDIINVLVASSFVDVVSVQQHQDMVLDVPTDEPRFVE